MKEFRRTIWATLALLLGFQLAITDALAVQATRPGASGAGFSAGCLKCRNDCETQYPKPLGPQQTCKRMCVMAGTCSKT
jgi:hypothetical protein